MLSVCLCVYLPVIARQRLGKQVHATTNTRNNKRTVGCTVFYTVRIF
jgi:hypothetical protein